ncbi:hypothetical protein [Sulfuracidifex metallicus]|uniref:hypothetical protein n=1 Tax=Sulfuracidifex metallicus TaxID=47303 RepID=UPI002273452C|nr:hypothetical protein [Sulfuracidifex metallicus]MCY0849793.1 hypothetical protein [Sulfuracidifex metallicus]
MDKVKEVSIRRCKNRPVRAIAKELGMNREDVEKIISKLIRDTNPYLDELVKGRKINTITIDISPLVEKSDFTKEYAQILLNDDRVLDYVAMKRGDHHDRLMDCIRYHVFLLMR